MIKHPLNTTPNTMAQISATDLKMKGIAAIESALADQPEAHLARLDKLP